MTDFDSIWRTNRGRRTAAGVDGQILGPNQRTTGMIQQRACNTKINALFHLKLFANIVIIGKNC